jgi:hypothetical protein
MRSRLIRGRLARMLWCAVLLAAPTAPAWCVPLFPTSGWLPLTQQGAIIGDPIDAGLPVPGIDSVGDKSDPAAFVNADANYLYFRMLVAANPYSISRSKYAAYAWTCLMDFDADPQTYELATAVDGIASPNLVNLLQNTTTAKPDSIDDPAETTLATYLTTDNTQEPPLAATSTIGGATNYFVDWAVAWTDLATATPTFTKNTAFRLVCGTSTSENSLTGGDVLDNGSGAVSFSTDASDAMLCGDNGCQYDAVFHDGFEGS